MIACERTCAFFIHFLWYVEEMRRKRKLDCDTLTTLMCILCLDFNSLMNYYHWYAYTYHFINTLFSGCCCCSCCLNLIWIHWEDDYIKKALWKKKTYRFSLFNFSISSLTERKFITIKKILQARLLFSFVSLFHFFELCIGTKPEWMNE